MGVLLVSIYILVYFSQILHCTLNFLIEIFSYFLLYISTCLFTRPFSLSLLSPPPLSSLHLLHTRSTQRLPQPSLSLSSQFGPSSSPLILISFYFYPNLSPLILQPNSQIQLPTAISAPIRSDLVINGFHCSDPAIHDLF